MKNKIKTDFHSKIKSSTFKLTSLTIFLIGILVVSFMVFFCFPKTSKAWGFYGHKKINRMATFTLPSELMGFYKLHIGFVEEHAVDADKRRYIDINEAPRHYIDIDYYGLSAIDSMPRSWKKAIKKYTIDTLKAHGIVPWHITKMTHQLTKAFLEENTDKILRYSADIGHYIADAHVPLHTTKNYNGQLTNQKGIHAFWESRIPELTGEEMDFFVGRAEYIEHVEEFIWNLVLSSYNGVDSVLRFERELNDKFPSDQKYVYETKGATTVRNYSREYTQQYNRMLDGQVERRMRAAILALGSVWYTCWVNAGKPDLNNIKHAAISDSLQGILHKEEEAYKKKTGNNYKGHND